MAHNKLKLNPDKTELIVFGSPQQRESLDVYFQSIFLATTWSLLIRFATLALSLMLIFHSRIKFVLFAITESADVVLANALVSSHIDDCNAAQQYLH